MAKKVTKKMSRVVKVEQPSAQCTPSITVELPNEMKLKMQAIVAMSEAQLVMARVLCSCSATVNVCNNTITAPEGSHGIRIATKAGA